MNKNKKDGSVYLEIFGDSPMNKILDFLVVYDQFDYSLTDIAKNAGISYSTLQLMWPNLEEEGIVIQSRVVGKAKMYQINKENPIVKAFITFYWNITKKATMEQIQKDKKVVCV